MFYDNTLLFMINGLSGHWVGMDKVIMTISQYGPVVFGLYLIGLWFSGESTNKVEQNRKRALYAIFSALLAMGMNQVISHIWFRDRPYVHNPVNRLLQGSQDASFPSDHAAGAFSIAGSLFGRTAGGTALMVFAAMVAVSRIYVGLHYPSDIIGGMAIGLISSWIIERNQAILEKPVVKILKWWNAMETKLQLLVPVKANNR
jgi:undecaprenyl-diphosphatase